MNYVDYYAVLGVSKEATADEIRRAYRKLAIKYHPDKTKGNKAASEKFLKINEANQVLSDPLKRQKYDQFGAEYEQYEAAGQKPGGFDWPKYARNGNGQATGEDYESMFTNGDTIDLFEILFGKEGARSSSRKGRVVKGEDLVAETTITLEEAYHGTSRNLQFENQTIKVTIPAGIADEQILRISGQGMPGYNNGPAGEVYLTIKIASNNNFLRKGDDLYGNLPVDLYTALLGGKALVKAFKGAMKVDIPKETANHRELRLRGLGMSVFEQPKTFGDLYITLDIVLPKNLSAKEIELFEKLAALRK